MGSWVHKLFEKYNVPCGISLILLEAKSLGELTVRLKRKSRLAPHLVAPFYVLMAVLGRTKMGTEPCCGSTGGCLSVTPAKLGCC